MDRREVLQSGLAAGVFLSLPAGLYQSALSKDDAPSERIRIGCVGLGGQGRGNMGKFARQVTALCDVDSQHLANAQTELAKKNPNKVQLFSDYRKLYDSKLIDAVVISTPDHWHALNTIHACQAGLDVYCEKPLTLMIAEGRKMVDVARAEKKIVQTGSQQRSSKQFRQACEFVRNQALGKLKKIEVGLPGPNFKGPAVPDGKAPPHLNYNLWLGPAAERPYNVKRVHYLFRFFWNYSGGQQANFGAHDLDIAQWALGMDQSGPVKIEGSGTFDEKKWFETPVTAKVLYTYQSGVTLSCTLGQGHRKGVTFICDKGEIFVNRGGLQLKASDPSMTVKDLPTGDIQLTESTNHHQNWLECIKSRKLPICDVEVGHRSATVCHLGNISIRLGRTLRWHPVKEEFIEDKEANEWRFKEYRKPWSL